MTVSNFLISVFVLPKQTRLSATREGKVAGNLKKKQPSLAERGKGQLSRTKVEKKGIEN